MAANNKKTPPDNPQAMNREDKNMATIHQRIQ
jgi:hypothetical protein